MKLPLHFARKLLELLEGKTVPASLMRHDLASRMLADGVLARRIQGRRKTVYSVPDGEALSVYLRNNFGINDLCVYIRFLEGDALTRAEAVHAASDSKIRQARTFKGFPVNCCAPVSATLNGEPVTILPRPGLFTFIHDFEAFIPTPEITIVGVENPENFRRVEGQKYLFTGITPLFVSRYPQSGDLIRWLQAVPNPYLHYGDFDFAGIGIFLNEYKKYLGPKARLFIPEGIDELVRKYGNRRLYDAQLHRIPEISVLEEKEIRRLVEVLHRHKKGLEQEILIWRQTGSEGANDQMG